MKLNDYEALEELKKEGFVVELSNNGWQIYLNDSPRQWVLTFGTGLGVAEVLAMKKIASYIGQKYNIPTSIGGFCIDNMILNGNLAAKAEYLYLEGMKT